MKNEYSSSYSALKIHPGSTKFVHVLFKYYHFVGECDIVEYGHLNSKKQNGENPADTTIPLIILLRTSSFPRVPLSTIQCFPFSWFSFHLMFPNFSTSFLFFTLHYDDTVQQGKKFLPMESKWLISSILHVENDAIGSLLFLRLSFEQWIIQVLV